MVEGYPGAPSRREPVPVDDLRSGDDLASATFRMLMPIPPDPARPVDAAAPVDAYVMQRALHG